MFDDIPQLDPLLWQIDPASNHRSKKCSFIRRKKYCAGDLLSLISTWHLLAFHMTIFFLKLLNIVSAYRQHIQPIFTEAIGPLQELELISRELSNLVGDDKLCLELFQKLLNLILKPLTIMSSTCNKMKSLSPRLPKQGFSVENCTPFFSRKSAR